VPEITKLVPPAVLPEDVEIDAIVGLPDGQSAKLETSFTGTLEKALPTPGQSAGGTCGNVETRVETIALSPGLATQTKPPAVNAVALIDVMEPGKLRFLKLAPTKESPSEVIPCGTMSEGSAELNTPFGS
jgi:hypothetical protein